MTDHTTATKKCRYCHNAHPATSEFFRKSGKLGNLSNCCKRCDTLIKNKKMCVINPFAVKNGLRGCKTCLRRFPDTNEYFYVDSRNPKWTPYECRKCATTRHTQYNNDNRETFSAYQREWRKDNHEHVLDYFRRYCEENAERVKKWQKDWYEANPERVRLLWLNREARKRALPDTFTKAQADRMLKYWGNACAISGEQDSLHFDHWIPLADPNCPGTVATNMIPMAAYLNFSKNDTPALEWLKVNFGEDGAHEIMAEINAYFDWVREQDSGKS